MIIDNILYVTTQITGTERYFSWAAYPSIWYSRLQRKVLLSLSQPRGVNSYVKFYPNDILKNPNVNFVKNDLKNITVLEENLVEILKKRNFDLIVTEACATSLLEIICTKSQVLCFFPVAYIKLYNNCIDMLKRRVHYSDSEEMYLDLIKKCLDEGFQESELKFDDEFLFNFGLNGINVSPIELSKKCLDLVILQ